MMDLHLRDPRGVLLPIFKDLLHESISIPIVRGNRHLLKGLFHPTCFAHTKNPRWPLLSPFSWAMKMATRKR